MDGWKTKLEVTALDRFRSMEPGQIMEVGMNELRQIMKTYEGLAMYREVSGSPNRYEVTKLNDADPETGSAKIDDAVMRHIEHVGSTTFGVLVNRLRKYSREDLKSSMKRLIVANKICGEVVTHRYNKTPVQHLHAISRLNDQGRR